MIKQSLMGVLVFVIAVLMSPQSVLAQCSGLIDSCVRVAINDFAKSGRLVDKVYEATVYLEDSEVIGVSILGLDNKYYANPSDKVDSLANAFPTEYVEIDNRLFCWQDKTKPLSLDIVSKLSQYNMIDSTYWSGFNGINPEFVVDDKKKATDYYFCRNNIRKFKKVKTSIGIGYYKRPKLKCD